MIPLIYSPLSSLVLFDLPSSASFWNKSASCLLCLLIKHEPTWWPSFCFAGHPLLLKPPYIVHSIVLKSTTVNIKQYLIMKIGGWECNIFNEHENVGKVPFISCYFSHNQKF